APAGADSAPSVDPPVDETVFADRNALAADALCRLFAYTDDERARRYAERTLDAVADRCADGVVSHFDGDASPTHLLADQARVAGAYTTAAQVLDPAYVESARAVADATVETLRDGETGAFLDGVPSGPGLLDRPLRPLDDNAAMADALVDLAALTGEDRYRKVAKAALGAFAGAADRMGVEVAAYATAAARVVDPPLTVAVADAPGSDLHRAALRVADHEKVVVPAAHESPAFDHPRGTAFVHRPDGVAGPADGPADLVALVSKTAE
ncbi:MAG: thioredoxin domain-containing protein, partial [Halobacteriaceae archaeon]